MPRTALFLALALTSLAAFSSLGASCPGTSCECFTCGSAIELAVFDTDELQLDTGWTVEATIDGFAVADIVNCDPVNRFGNSCSFGTQTGMYRITIRGEGFETRQIAARVAAVSGDDCCSLCINPTPVTAFLQRTDAQ